MNSICKYSVLLTLFLFNFNLTAQVGIGTTSPNAQLEIKASNQTTPAATDGILIPKVDMFPAGITANQDAMIVYLTTTSGSNPPGFYYWNQATTSWLPIGSSVKKIDDLIDGKSDSDGTQDGSSIFIGIDAGMNDDLSDNRNVGIGYQSLYSNTTGYSNTANGTSSLYYNTIGYANTANGSYSLQNNTSGYENTAIGSNSLQANTSGRWNTAIGNLSLFSNTTGIENTASGHRSLFYNTTGTGNTANGAFALHYNTIGGGNIATGTYSLFSNTTGTGNTATGLRSLYSNTTGGENTAYGLHSLYSNTTGTQNTATGHSSLQANTTGFRNTSTGYSSLYSNTTGNYTTATGWYSLYSNTTGTGNTGTGYESLRNNTTGNNNTATGFDALRTNTTGVNNTAAGYNSLRSNNIGSDNTATGLESLYSNTLGYRNTATGSGSLYTNTTGDYNTAIGFESLNSSVTGNNNTALGANSLQNTTGSNNTAIGLNAGRNNATGSGNVLIGNGAGYDETGSNKLYIDNNGQNDYNALIYGEFDNSLFRINGRAEVRSITDATGTIGTGSIEIANSLRLDGNEIITNTNTSLFLQADNNGDLGVDGATLYVDSSTDRVGIGISTPNAKLQILGANDGIPSLQVDWGRVEFSNTTDASGTSNSGVLEIGNSLRIDGNEIITNTNTSLFLQADNNGDLGVDGATLYVDSSANRVGINTNTPDYPFSVNGAANLNEGVATGVALRVNGSEALWYNGTYFSWGFGGTYNYFSDRMGLGIYNPNVQLDVNGSIEYTGTITDVSDRRLKENLRLIDSPIEKIKQITGYSYNMIDDTAKKREYGVMAQDVQKVLPDVVSIVDSENGYLGVSYIQLIPILLEAIKDQQVEIQGLKDKLSKYDALEARIKSLETGNSLLNSIVVEKKE